MIYEWICWCLFDIMILVYGYEQDKIPNSFATSQKTILLCLKTCLFTPCTFSLFYLSMHAMQFSIFGIYHTISELGKPLKNLWSSHCLLSKSYFQHFKSFSSIFPNLKQNSMQIHCSFKSARFWVHKNCKWTTPICNVQDSTQQWHMLQPSSMQEMPQHMLLCLQPAAIVSSCSQSGNCMIASCTS
jgi:hypothetical protein